MNNIKTFLNRSIKHMELNFIQLAIEDIKDALKALEIDATNTNATTCEYYDYVKLLILEKYGSEGYDAFCLGTFLILKSKNHSYDLTDFLKNTLCELKDNK